jgi:hypothetical protein
LRLQHLYEAGIRSASKLHRLTGIPLRTKYNNLERFEEGQSSERVSGSGRHRILKPGDRRRVAQLAVHHPAWSAARIKNEAMKRETPKVTTRMQNAKYALGAGVSEIGPTRGTNVNPLQ